MVRLKDESSIRLSREVTAEWRDLYFEGERLFGVRYSSDGSGPIELQIEGDKLRAVASSLPASDKTYRSRSEHVFGSLRRKGYKFAVAGEQSGVLSAEDVFGNEGGTWYGAFEEKGGDYVLRRDPIAEGIELFVLYGSRTAEISLPKGVETSEVRLSNGVIGFQLESGLLFYEVSTRSMRTFDCHRFVDMG